MQTLEPRVAARILLEILLVNAFEHAALALKNEDCIWGPVHASAGQEATVASIEALHKTDKVTGTHRSHHHFLAKALHYVLPPDWNPVCHDFPKEGIEVVRRTLAEIMGLAPGFCGGRGGSMHLRWVEAGFLGSNAIVAGGIPIATGAAFAEKVRETGNLVVCYFSDGAVNQGAFHEACNFAGAWHLPVIFFLENNLYAVATHTDNVCAVKNLVARAAAYDMDGYVVDGSDPVALYKTVRSAAREVRNGKGPCLIEAQCYRTYHHAGDLPGSAYKYRTKEEEQRWAEKNVCRRFPKQLVGAGLLTNADIRRIHALADTAVAQAVDFCVVGSSPRTVRPELWPAAESAAEGMRSDGAEWQDIEFHERENFSEFRSIKYSDAIAAVTGRWLEKDPESFVLGEEVANFGGGAYGATKGLLDRFSDRILNTPISEAGIVGLALGAAMSGMRPIAEIMFPDFSLVGADQLFNQVAKARHMYGNTTQLPLVVRTRIATGCGYGGQHSMDPVGLYALFPGWRMVAPADAFDYVGLFNSAMHSLDPVVILEHHALYDVESSVPAETLDYFVRLDKARVVVPGDDVTVLAYSSLVPRCTALHPMLLDQGASAEIIDLRTLDLPGIDYETIGKSVMKTGAVVIVEQAAKSQAIGPRIAASITERFFDYLDGPVTCLTSLDVPNSVSRVLERAALLQDKEILSTTHAVAQRRWR